MAGRVVVGTVALNRADAGGYHIEVTVTNHGKRADAYVASELSSIEYLPETRTLRVNFGSTAALTRLSCPIRPVPHLRLAPGDTVVVHADLPARFGDVDLGNDVAAFEVVVMHNPEQPSSVVDLTGSRQAVVDTRAARGTWTREPQGC